MTSHWIICVFLLFFFSQTSFSLDTCGGTTVNGICYTVVLLNSTWQMAADYCGHHGGQLAAVPSQQVQQAIVDQVKVQYSARMITSLWIGGMEDLGTESSRIWKWTTDGSRIGSQGCYNDNIDSLDLPHIPDEGKVRDLGSCIKLCQARGYKYAGIQAGGFCYCGDTFGKYGTSALCNSQCIVNNNITNWCGGTSQNNVYDPTGSYAQWGYLQPNNLNNYQTCATLDKNLATFKFSDEQCSKMNNYICQIYNRAQCTGTETNGAFYQGTITSNCYYVSKDQATSYLNWFEAKAKCIEYGGELVKIPGSLDYSAVHEELKMILENAWISSSGAQLWIGPHRGGWSWKTQEPFVYTNWFVNEPDSPMQGCIMMNKTMDWMWSDEMCISYAFFVCQGGNIPTPEPSTTTSTPKSTSSTTAMATTSRTSSNSLTSSTSSGGSGNNTPQSGALTSDGGLTSVEIVILVVLLVIGLIAAVLIILLVIYCCYKKETKVDPKKTPPETVYPESVSSSRSSTDYIDINDMTDFFDGESHYYR